MSGCTSGERKIDFSALRLIGRDAEIDRLEQIYEEIAEEPPPTTTPPTDKESQSNIPEKIDCVLIAGQSGCGKTKLIESLRCTVLYSGGTFCSGKFDQLSSARPYSALVDAIGSLFQNLARLLGEDIKADISAKLDASDLSLLYALVPSARAALQGGAEDEVEKIVLDCVSQQWMFVRLKSMVRKLFETITTLVGPLVLFLDDLQWCDSGSIELINSLLSDEKLLKFLFVGAYRDDEILKQNSALAKLNRFHDVNCTIKLENLSQQDVNRLVATTLRLDVSETLPLSREIHRKTAGNCFFVIHFLKFLELKELVMFSLVTYQWTWEMDRIISETEATDNVADVVTLKLRDLPKESQSALAVAACFGNKFAGLVLGDLLQRLALEDSNISSVSSQDLNGFRVSVDTPVSPNVDELLTSALEAGIIDKLQGVEGGDMIVYKFTHDKIQAAAYDLVPSKDRLKLHLLLGKMLWGMLPDAAPDQHETLLVKIVEQLHRAGPRLFKEDEAFRVEVARLNLEAARCVQRNAAFLTAAGYLESSPKLLGEDRWSAHYQLTLETMNVKAEVEVCCRRYELCEVTVQDILSHATCIADKMQAYVVLVDQLGFERKIDEILPTVYGVVSQFGFRAPKYKAGFHHVAGQMLRTKRAVNRYTDEDLLGYRRCDNRAIEGCLKLLARTGAIAWMSNYMGDMVLLAMLSCHISLSKGLTKFSANAFACFAGVLAKMGDIKAGRRFGKLALEMSDCFQAKECDGQVMFAYYAFIHHSLNPMHELLDPLIQAGQFAKASGDIEHSQHACCVYTFTYIICGLPLSGIEEDTKVFITEMQQYKNSSALAHVRLFRQMALNLMHKSGDPLCLEGEEITDLLSLSTNGNQFDNKRTEEGILLCKLFLSCYLGLWKGTKKLVDQHAKLKDHEYPVSCSTFFPFFRGIMYLRLARKGFRGCKRQAAREIRRIRSFVRQGFVNCTHLLHILEAGMLSVSKKTDALVRTSYDTAIACASRAGFPHDAALASEEAAIYFRGRGQMWHEIYRERGVNFYQQWGAGTKLEMLEAEGLSVSAGGGNGALYSYSEDGTTAVSSAIRGKSRRGSFHLNDEHETTDWYHNQSASMSRVRRNLSITDRRGLPTIKKHPIASPRSSSNLIKARYR